MNKTLNYAKNIRAIRERDNKTQTEFAKILGVSQEHLSNIENDLKIPSLILVDRIVRHYNVTADSVLYG